MKHSISMKLSNKVIVHPLTLGLLLICLFAGYVKYVFYIFMIISIHELGHIVIALAFNRRVESITFLPFGGLVKMDSLMSSDIFEDLLIASGGIFFQTVLGFIVAFLAQKSLLESSTAEFLSSYNRLIILFNLLPICPLDGYKIYKGMSELFFPYRLTFNVALLSSIIILIAISFLVPRLVLDNIFVFTFLVFMAIDEYKSRKYVLNRFYVERLNHEFSYPKKEVFKLKNLFKNRTNYIGGIHEKKVLQKFFTTKNH